MIQELIKLGNNYLINNGGLTVENSNNEIKINEINLIPYSLYPSMFPKRLFLEAQNLQCILNKLIIVWNKVFIIVFLNVLNRINTFESIYTLATNFIVIIE